jgi:hypothetical protein
MKIICLWTSEGYLTLSKQQNVKQMRNAYKILVDKPDGMRQLSRSDSKLEHNVKIYLKVTRMCCLYWIYMAQDTELLQWRALVDTVTKIFIPP